MRTPPISARAAVDAFDTFAVGLAVAELDGEQSRIREELVELASEQSPEKRAHTEEARDALDRLGVGGVLSGPLFEPETE